MRKRLAPIFVALLACGETVVDPDPEPTRCEADPASCRLETTMSDITLGAGEEIDGLCQSWTLDNPEELWVTRVTMNNDGGYHHSNWFFVPDDQFAVADGAWNCSDQEFSELQAALLGGFLFAQTTQSRDEEQRFARGAAIRVPPYARVIGNTHLLNALDQPLTTRLSMQIDHVPVEEVTVKLVPARISYLDLDIPANATSEFTTECDIATTYQNTMGRPLAFELFYVLPHYHALGVYFQFEIAGGDRDGEILYRHDGFGGDNFGKPFDPPIDLAAAGATGVRFTCGFMNPRDEAVGWGIGDQEMCVTAIFAGTDMGFEAAVINGGGEVVGTRPDGTIMNQGPCMMAGLPWNHDKEGGPPR